MRKRRSNRALLKDTALILPLYVLFAPWCLAGAQAARPVDSRTQPATTETGSPAPAQDSSAAPVAPIPELACAGFIEYEPAAPVRTEVVGGEQEQEQRHFAEGDYVFLNAGASQGLRAGDEYTVVRPRGRFSSKLSGKRGTLGVFTQAVGRVRVTQVRQDVSVALVTGACEAILLGDTLRESRPAPQRVERGGLPFDRFAPASGKQQGRIVMAREGREMVSHNQVVFIDLGREDNLRAGDVLTVYRPVGTGTVTRITNEEMTDNTRGGYESERFRGGKFSNKAQRARKPNGTGIFDQKPVTTPMVKSRRPAPPRKVVGEAIVLGVEERTATVLITRVAQEIHTGDYVEVQ